MNKDRYPLRGTKWKAVLMIMNSEQTPLRVGDEWGCELWKGREGEGWLGCYSILYLGDDDGDGSIRLMVVVMIKKDLLVVVRM